MNLYAGSFTRFFLGQWEGFTLDQASSEVATGEEATPDEVRSYFEAFREGLGTTLGLPLTWQEAANAPYTVTAIDEADFGALIVIAARATVADKRMRPVAPAAPWYDDPAVTLLQDEVQDFVNAHHLVKADTWLPGAFSIVLETEVPERDMIVGSLPELCKVLHDMDAVLNRPSETTRKLSSTYVGRARIAHSALRQLTAWATAQNAPILIDP